MQPYFTVRITYAGLKWHLKKREWLKGLENQPQKLCVLPKNFSPLKRGLGYLKTPNFRPYFVYTYRPLLCKFNDFVLAIFKLMSHYFKAYIKGIPPTLKNIFVWVVTYVFKFFFYCNFVRYVKHVIW